MFSARAFCYSKCITDKVFGGFVILGKVAIMKKLFSAKALFVAAAATTALQAYSGGAGRSTPLVSATPLIASQPSLSSAAPCADGACDSLLSRIESRPGKCLDDNNRIIRPLVVDGVAKASDAMRAALLSLQGLANRRGPCVYFFENSKESGEDRVAEENFLDFTYGSFRVNPHLSSPLGDASISGKKKLSKKELADQIAILKTLIVFARAKGVVIYDDDNGGDNKEAKLSTLIPAINLAGVKGYALLNGALYDALKNDLPLQDPLYDIVNNENNVTDFRSLFTDDYICAHTRGCVGPNVTAADRLYQAHKWSMDHVFSEGGQAKAQLYLGLPRRGPQSSLDLALQRRLPAFWRPFAGDSKRDADEDYSAPLEKLIEDLMQQTRPNAYIYGWVGTRYNGLDYGWDEFPATKFFAHHAKLIINTAGARNLSFHNQFPLNGLPAQKAFTGPVPTYVKNPHKKYIAFTMMDCGTSPWYFETWFHRYQWTNANRAKIPMSWAMTPQMADLMPHYMKRIYQTASYHNYFVASEGLGYGMLFENYGKIPSTYAGADPANPNSTVEGTLNLYFHNLDEKMRLVGMKGFSLHSHPGQWSDADVLFLNKEIVPRMTDQMTDLLLDMNVNKAAPIKSDLLGASKQIALFRPITKFVGDNEKYALVKGAGEVCIYNEIAGKAYNEHVDDVLENSDGSKTCPELDQVVVSRDEAAVRHLVRQIQAYVKGNADQQFLLVTAVSWDYSPARIQVVLERLNEMEKQKGSADQNRFAPVTEFQMGQLLRASKAAVIK